MLLILSLTIRICVDTRRLHDRGKPGWLLVPMMGPSLVWTLTHGPNLKVAFVLWLISGTNLVTVVMFLAMLGTSIWYWIELGFRSGDAGDNEYGPPPLGPSGGWSEESLGFIAGGNPAANLAKPPVSEQAMRPRPAATTKRPSQAQSFGKRSRTA